MGTCIKGEAEMITYKVFVRDWWTVDANGRKQPNPGARKHTIATRLSYDEALTMAKEYNATHNPGPRSRKAEFMEE